MLENHSPEELQPRPHTSLKNWSLMLTFEALFDMSKGREVILLSTFLCIIQSLFKSAHYDLIDSFGLPISLWIGWSGISILYTKIRTIFPEGFAIKLNAIIRDESIRNPESSNNVLPDEPFDIYIPDVS